MAQGEASVGRRGPGHHVLQRDYILEKAYSDYVLGMASAASNFKTSCFGMTNHHSDPWRPRSATSVRRCDATALFGGMLHGRPCLNEHPVVRPRLTSKGRPAARLNTRLVAADNRPALLAVRSLSLAVRLCLWRHVHTVQVSPAASCLISHTLEATCDPAKFLCIVSET